MYKLHAPLTPAAWRRVFYRWMDDRIAEVWSVIDNAAIEEQL